MFISELMMITVMNSKPYQSNMENISECVNEVVVILVSYCLVVFSDFVPEYELEVKEANGNILISIVLVVACVYIIMIVYSAFMELVRKGKKYWETK